MSACISILPLVCSVVCVCLPFCLSTCRSICWFICCPFVCPSRLSVISSFCPSVCLSSRPSVFFIVLSIGPFFRLSVNDNLRLPVHSFTYLFISFCIRPSTRPSVSLPSPIARLSARFSPRHKFVKSEMILATWKAARQ